MEKQKLLKPVLIGGLFSGLLSVLPCISGMNCVCCMWVVLGGGVSSYILVSGASTPPSDGAGTLAGVGSGVVAIVLTTFYTFIFLFVTGVGEFQAQMVEISRQMQGQPAEIQEILRPTMDMLENTSPFLLLMMGSVVNFFFYIAAGAIGGMVGTRIFTPRRFGPAQQGFAPPGYGYQQGPSPPWQGTVDNIYTQPQTPAGQPQSDQKQEYPGEKDGPDDESGPSGNSGGAPPSWGGN